MSELDRQKILRMALSCAPPAPKRRRLLALGAAIVAGLAALPYIV